MKKSLLKHIAGLLLVIILCNIISLSYPSSAEANDLDSLWIGKSIKDWVIDTDNDYIHIITEYSNKLVTVDTEDFNVVNEIDLGSKAMDIEIYNNKLYITLIDENKIIEYDILTKRILNTIDTEKSPLNLSVYDGKIFYGNRMWHESAIYVYDLSNKSNNKIFDGIYNPTVSIDKSTGVLYVKGSSGIYIYGLDSNNYETIYKSKEIMNGDILVDGSDVFSDNIKYDKSLNVIHGKYTLSSPSIRDSIVAVNDNYVFLSKAIFNRDNFIKVGDLPFESEYTLADNKYVYVYDKQSKSIVRKNITSLVDNNIKWSKSDLTEWVLDEERGYIYAVSKHENRLLFINKDTLEIEDELIIFSDPTDIELDDGKLYISLSGSNKISVVDIDTKSLDREIVTGTRPYRLEKYGEKIYYVENSWSKIYEYDLTNNSETNLVINLNNNHNNLYFNPEIVIDNANGIMYLGETGSSSGDAFAIDLKNYNLIGTTDYNHSYGFGYAIRKVFINGDEIFYSGKRINKDNMNIKGSYKEQIIAVNDDYVFSYSGIYDKKSFTKVGELPFNSLMMLIDSNNIIYYYDKTNSSINKLDINSINLDIPTNYYNSEDSLPVSMEIEDWVYSEDNDYIYAISNVTGKLLFIDARDFTIEDELYIGESPSDIEIFDGKIYIALSGESNIATIDSMNKGNISKIRTDINPYKIQVDESNVYYSGESSSEKVYIYDKIKGYSYTIGNRTYVNPHLLIDRENDILYIGDNTYYPSIVRVSTKDYTVVKEYRYSRNNVNEKSIFKNDEYIFWGKFKIKISDMTLDRVYDSKVLYSKGSYVYNKEGIEAYELYKQIADFPFNPNLILSNDKGEVYLYNYANNTIYKYPSKYEIDPKLNDSLKINLNDEEQFVFSWDEVPNAIGYNLWYYTDMNFRINSINSNMVKDNSYVDIRNYSGEYHEIIYFGVTPVMEEVSYEILRADMKAIVIDKLNLPVEETNDNSIDLSFTSTSSMGHDLDGGSAAIFRINENLFNSAIEKIDDNIDRLEFNSDLKYDRFSINLSGSIYDNLYEVGKDKELKINTSRGKYIWPVSLINLSEVTSNPKTAYIDIGVRRERGENLGNIVYDMFNLDLDVIGNPIRFTVDALTEEGRLSIKNMGKGYFQCWIPLEEEPDKSETVGIFYDLENKKYQHAPTKFYKDSEGKWWAIFNQNANGSYALVRYNKTFEDVKNHWAEDDINLLASKLIVKGMTHEEFMPDDNVTRAQYISLLITALGLHPKSNSSQSFDDVDEEDWYADVVETAVNLGIVRGYEDGTFKPNKLISREEMSVLIVNALKLLEEEKGEVNEDILKSFKDSNDIGSWAKESAAIAAQNGLINGDEKGSFNPKDYATRAQSAVVIKNLLEKSELIEE